MLRVENGGMPPEQPPQQPPMKLLIQIMAVQNPDGTAAIAVASGLPGLAEALGVLDLAGDVLKQQNAQQAQGPKIEVARGNVPRMP
jgi:hypothetical protein